MKTTRELLDEAIANNERARAALHAAQNAYDVGHPLRRKALDELMDASLAMSDATDAHVAWLDEQNASHKVN